MHIKRLGAMTALTAILSACAMITSVTADAAQAGTSHVRPAAARHALYTMRLSPVATAELHSLTSTARGRSELRAVFSRSFGSGGRVGVSSGAKVAPALSCGFTSCGISSEGGRHLWMIASYAAVLKAGIGKLVPICEAGLDAYITPLGAALVCGSAEKLLALLIQHEPAVSNHGVWAALYFNGKLQGGRW